MIRLYAFVTELVRLPARPGVGGAPLEERALYGIGAVTSTHGRPTQGDPRADAVAHGLVVEALTSVASAVLPVQFGETFVDGLAFREAVRARRAELRSALERVRGCVEIGVRIAAREARETIVPATGTAYLQARLAERDIATELNERLQHVSRASLVSRGETCYLVERAFVDRALACAREFAEAHPELSVVCTGPWAPYSFGGAL